MSVKEYVSFQFNGISWKASLLGEEVVLLECAKATSPNSIHESVQLIEHKLEDKLMDIVPAYHSIAIFTKIPLHSLVDVLESSVFQSKHVGYNDAILELPICYELGLDLDHIASNAGLTVEEVIEIHLKGIYRVMFVGFTPGFIYADGLDEKLICPRLKNPRKQIPAGSIGIGGDQTGIYALSSPGGWNIIGQTPTAVFDTKRENPMLIDVGARYRFFRITPKEFEAWED